MEAHHQARFEEAGTNLRGADQRTGCHCLQGACAPCFEKARQMHGHGCHHRPRRRQTEHKHRSVDGNVRLTDVVGGCGQTRCCGEQKIQWQAHNDVCGRLSQAGLARAKFAGAPRCERPTNRARKSRQQCDARDGGTSFQPVDPAECRVRRVVKPTPFRGRGSARSTTTWLANGQRPGPQVLPQGSRSRSRALRGRRLRPRCGGHVVPPAPRPQARQRRRRRITCSTPPNLQRCGRRGLLGDRSLMPSSKFEWCRALG